MIHCTKDDFIKGGEHYDLIFDTFGKTPESKGNKALGPSGISINIKMTRKDRAEYLIFLKELIKNRKLQAFIDRCYALELTAEARKYAETGHKNGNAVITVEHGK